MDRIKVLIVDDNIRLRWAVMEALAKEESLEVVDEASDGNEATEKARALKPDVILMDMYMPNCTGVEATRQIQAETPETNILMFTVSEAEADLVSALGAGARGYLLKNEKPEQIIQAIHYVARGGILISPSMAAKLLDEFKTQAPAARVATGGAQANLPAEVEVVAKEEEKALVEQAAGELPEAVREPVQEAPPALGSTLVAAGEDLVSNADLVLSPPLVPTIVLRFHQWLKEVAKGDIGMVTASWGGETVISVDFREPIPLLQMLAELPDVTEVVEEPYTGQKASPLGGLEIPPERAAGVQQRAPRQLRLTLKAG
ncbi:response regulator transcription factor [Chloroflexota bacterium]